MRRLLSNRLWLLSLLAIPLLIAGWKIFGEVRRIEVPTDMMGGLLNGIAIVSGIVAVAGLWLQIRSNQEQAEAAAQERLEQQRQEKERERVALLDQIAAVERNLTERFNEHDLKLGAIERSLAVLPKLEKALLVVETKVEAADRFYQMQDRISILAQQMNSLLIADSSRDTAIGGDRNERI